MSSLPPMGLRLTVTIYWGAASADRTHPSVPARRPLIFLFRIETWPTGGTFGSGFAAEDPILRGAGKGSVDGNSLFSNADRATAERSEFKTDCLVQIECVSAQGRSDLLRLSQAACWGGTSTAELVRVPAPVTPEMCALARTPASITSTETRPSRASKTHEGCLCSSTVTPWLAGRSQFSRSTAPERAWHQECDDHEPFRSGHFPGHSSDAGRAIVEAMAPGGSAAYFLMGTLETPQDGGSLHAIDGGKIPPPPVLPGDSRFPLRSGDPCPDPRQAVKLRARDWSDGKVSAERIHADDRGPVTLTIHSDGNAWGGGVGPRPSRSGHKGRRPARGVTLPTFRIASQLGDLERQAINRAGL